jgi:glycosyltransferase involved in cell wall biosynthesis
MKIAQVSPLYESVPPKLYGGTERIVSFLTEGLLELGHEVTLFASGDSVTRGKLVAISENSLRLSGISEPYASHILQLQHVVERAADFDVIHFHTDYIHFPISRQSGYTHLTTLHGRLDLPELTPLYQKFSDIPLVSISHAQRTPLSFANWVGNVYHGLDRDLFQEGGGNGGYAVFLGRISREKRPDRAIEIARQAGLTLKIAAKIDRNDRQYYETEVKHLMEQPHVEYLGEVNESEKQDLLGNAKVLLFPIDWPEPFGIVMIEALACGTPVVAFDNGSVREIIDNGVNGYVVDSMEEAVKATLKIDAISRSVCRGSFLERFEALRMAKEYVEIYESLIEANNGVRIPFGKSYFDKGYNEAAATKNTLSA